MIWTVAKKELRGYFNSAIAIIFLGGFLATTLYTFFWREKFFARGTADLRPLFEWMPILLIILVSALAMRLWSEERRGGTLEVLLTLPVARWRLVMGKFVAGMLLIAVALALTLGLPITVSQMGNLDWGPVFGGYLAALLLAAAYLAIALCVSAATDNSVVASIGTMFICGLLYLVRDIGGDIGRALSTGERFQSVARGVLDLRDLAYYGAIVAIGIALNVLLLQRVSWSTGPRAAPRRRSMLLAVGLVLGNAVLLPIVLAPLSRARIDMTRDGRYSLSEGTKKIVRQLPERMLIRAYLTEDTHPKLAPLIPQVRDLLEEYRIAADGKITVEIIDPTGNDAAIGDALERFGIKSQGIDFATSTKQTRINAFFDIGIEYGDQHVALGLKDLLSIKPAGDDVDVSLDNFEYQVTKSIKKAIADFSSLDNLFATAPGKITITSYFSDEKTLPEPLRGMPAKFLAAAEKLKAQANGKLEYVQVDPKTYAEKRTLAERYGIEPYPDFFGAGGYYFHVIVQIGEVTVRLGPQPTMEEGQIVDLMKEGLKRAAPGFTRVVGLWVPPPLEIPPQLQGQVPPGQQMPAPQAFETLRRHLSGSYEVRDVKLDGPVANEIEALVIAGPANLDATAQEAVDQYLMRGGALVILNGRFRISLLSSSMGGIPGLETVTTGLEGLLKAWGITVGDELVNDVKADALQVPVDRKLPNGMMVQEIVDVPYPAFVQAIGMQLSGTNPITAGIAGTTMYWVSPVSVEAQVGADKHTVNALVQSTEESWLGKSLAIVPDMTTFPGTGYAPPEAGAQRGRRDLAVAITGGFASGLPPQDKPGDATAPPKPRSKHSPSDARIVVFGSSAFASDDVLQLAANMRSQFAPSAIDLVHNAVDWALSDTDLLEIRSHNAAASALTTDEDSHSMWRTVNIALAAIGLAIVVLVAWLRRRAVKPVLVGKAG